MISIPRRKNRKDLTRKRSPTLPAARPCSDVSPASGAVGDHGERPLFAAASASGR